MLRHRPVPERRFGIKVIVARPRDGAPVVIEPDAVLVWRQLDDWTTPREIDCRLAEAFPEVAREERVMGRARVLQNFEDDDLLERS